MPDFHLIVENGEIKKEEGFFFVAAPFTVLSANKKISCEFKRIPSEHHGYEVVYDVKDGTSKMIQLEHPDYVSPVEPEKLPKDTTFFYAALVKLGIAKDKAYALHFDKDDVKKLYSYEVKQAQLPL